MQLRVRHRRAEHNGGAGAHDDDTQIIVDIYTTHCRLSSAADSTAVNLAAAGSSCDATAGPQMRERPRKSKVGRRKRQAPPPAAAAARVSRPSSGLTRRAVTDRDGDARASDWLSRSQTVGCRLSLRLLHGLRHRRIRMGSSFSRSSTCRYFLRLHTTLTQTELNSGI